MLHLSRFIFLPSTISLFESSLHFYDVWKSTLVIMWELFKFDMICSHFLLWEMEGAWRYSSVHHKRQRCSLWVYKDSEMFKQTLRVSRFFFFRSTSRQREKRHQKVPYPCTPILPPSLASLQTIPLLSNKEQNGALLHLWMTLSFHVSKPCWADCEWVAATSLSGNSIRGLSSAILYPCPSNCWPVRWWWWQRREQRLWAC